MSRMIIEPAEAVGDGHFDRQQRIAWWRQDLIEQAKVMVVGAGAIGNETIKNLMLMGFRRILVCDFDTIEASNLSRTVLFRGRDIGRRKAEVAAERAVKLALSPDPRVTVFHGDIVWDLGLGVFRTMDVVLGCLDNVEARLAVNRACRLVGKPWIDAGMQELFCRVSVYGAGSPSCYECGVTDAQLVAARQRYSCDNVKKQMVAAGRVPTVQVASALVGALQAQEAVKLICGTGAPSNRMFYFQGIRNEFETFDIPARVDCTAHGLSLPPPVPLDLSCRASLGTFLETVSNPALTGPGAQLDLSGDRGFVMQAKCRRCGVTRPVLRAKHRLYEQDLWCLDGRGDACQHNRNGTGQPDAMSPAHMDEATQFSFAETSKAVLDMALEDLGVPPLHILRVIAADGTPAYYELRADYDSILPGWISEHQNS